MTDKATEGERHPFKPMHGNTKMCWECDRRASDPIHLSDDVENDRFVPLETESDSKWNTRAPSASVVTPREVPETSLAMFRNSVGFQINFVPYSGLDAASAIDNICKKAAEMFNELLATPSSTEIEISNRALEAAARACDDLRAIRPTTERGLLIATECAIAIRALAVSNSETGDDK